MSAEIEEGYKQTEVGVIPVSWEVMRLGELADIQRGASPRPIDSPQWFDTQSQVGWVRITDVTQSKTSTLTATTEYLSAAGIANSRFLPSGSLIMSICATVGVPVITAIDTCIHDGFVGFSNLKSATKEYIYIVLKSLTKEFQSMGQTGSQANLNSDLVRNHKVFVPPISEQRAIASALADVDALLEYLGNLVNKKLQIRQAVMQELLTGKTNLEGFENKRREVKLSEVVEIIPSGIYGNDHQESGMMGFPVATTAHISSDDKWNAKEMSIRYFYMDKYEKYSPIEGDLIVVKSSGSAASIQSGKVGFVDHRIARSFIFSNFLMLLRPKNIAPKYLYYLLTSPKVKRLLPSLVEASTYPNIRIPEYLGLEFTLPPLPEQEAITSILSEMDAELEALEERVAKTHNLKQGMMQELLTGRTRLI
ncbi:restriction endonuclease subunit S [Deinococcus marmoris]|uniref:restriction endonuclease subunit S n=1 Tax=Deinococcus marmoris TaxID=249408 RepID=UPI0009DCDB43|nr:restriction endonuclease subunit S [Deinococcus marmoris]